MCERGIRATGPLDAFPVGTRRAHWPPPSGRPATQRPWPKGLLRRSLPLDVLLQPSSPVHPTRAEGRRPSALFDSAQQGRPGVQAVGGAGGEGGGPSSNQRKVHSVYGGLGRVRDHVRLWVHSQEQSGGASGKSHC